MPPKAKAKATLLPEELRSPRLRHELQIYQDYGKSHFISL